MSVFLGWMETKAGKWAKWRESILLIIAIARFTLQGARARSGAVVEFQLQGPGRWIRERNERDHDRMLGRGRAGAGDIIFLHDR